MKSYKLIRNLHLWAALPFGIVITLICLSGASLVFEPEITAAMYPDVYRVASVQGTPATEDEALQHVTELLPDGVEATRVKTFDSQDRTYQVFTTQGRKASVFYDPYARRITGEYKRPPFFWTMFKLHRWLLAAPDNPHGGMSWGKMTVGVSTVAFFFTVITGVWLWVVRARRNLRGNLAVTRRGFWKKTHTSGGIYIAIPAVIMALTGLTWSFGWWHDAVYSLFGASADPKALVYSLHTGAFGGIATRTLWFVATLICATLPITGYWLFIRRKR